MCGIIACWRSTGSRETLLRSLEDGIQLLSHRGPDDQGSHVEAVPGSGYVGLGHTRLAILDLTQSGHQPMTSACGRYVLVYNGEVYNYIELATRLRNNPLAEGCASDTAVVLQTLIELGPAALNQFNGMWALAFYDRTRRQLLVARDRLGVKPLYFFRSQDQVIFASECKVILRATSSRTRLNRNSLARYLFQGVMDDSSETFYEGILAVPPASYAVIDLSGAPCAVNFVRFWSRPSLDVPAFGDDERQIVAGELRELFFDAVRIRLRSDVPVGILLSGGLDSSAILAAAKATGSDRIVALSSVSDDPASNEEPFIDRMIAHCGAASLKVRLDNKPEALLEQLPEICWFNDQPAAALSTVAHYNLMAKAREHGIVVLLTGQGSDEQLGGYGKYLYYYLAEQLRKGRVAHATRMLVACITKGTILREFRMREAKRYIPFLNRTRSIPTTAYFAEAVRCDLHKWTTFEERTVLDLTRYSLPMILHYEDRMSMAASREIRVPFLDFRFVEMLARIPATEKLRNGWTKAILRDALRHVVPDEIRFRRDKKGFSTPDFAWLRTVFREPMRKFFRSDLMVYDAGMLNRQSIVQYHEQFLRGDTHVNAKEIFRAYCLEIWLRRFTRFVAI